MNRRNMVAARERTRVAEGLDLAREEAARAELLARWDICVGGIVSS